MPDIFKAYLITFGWALVGSVSMGLGIIIVLALFDLSTRKVDEWELLKQGNIAMAIILAAVIISLGIVVAAAIHPSEGEPMHRKTVFLVFLGMAIGICSPIVRADLKAALHTFTDDSGTYRVSAVFEKFEVVSGISTVWLRKSDGESISLPMNRLSVEDQKWIREQLRGQRASIDVGMSAIDARNTILASRRERLTQQAEAAERLRSQARLTALMLPRTSYNTSGRVNVRGYYRKDGTYVRPHTRSRPSR